MGKGLSMSSIPLRWVSKCTRYTVTISDSCIESIMKMAKKHYPMEVGTSLIGYYSDDGFDAFICRTAPLPPDSKGLAHTFVRGTKGMRAFFSNLLKRYC